MFMLLSSYEEWNSVERQNWAAGKSLQVGFVGCPLCPWGQAHNCHGHSGKKASPNRHLSSKKQSLTKTNKYPFPVPWDVPLDRASLPYLSLCLRYIIWESDALATCQCLHFPGCQSRVSSFPESGKGLYTLWQATLLPSSWASIFGALNDL